MLDLTPVVYSSFSTLMNSKLSQTENKDSTSAHVSTRNIEPYSFEMDEGGVAYSV